MKIHDRGIGRGVRFGLLATAAVAVASSGCPGVRNGDSQVWGRVTVRGEPVTEGTIVLRPVVDKWSTWAAGALDGDGRFHLEGSRSDVPMLSGDYFVYLRPPLRLDYASGVSLPPPDYPVPEKYLNSDAPLIQVQVTDEPMLLDLRLDD